MHRFRNLNVYGRSLRFKKKVREITKLFPKDELFGLTAQFRRAANSISLNIAEGAGNGSQKEFRRFLSYSIRSGYECVACIDIALINEYFDESMHAGLDKEIHEMIAMLVGLQKSLHRK